MSRGFEVSLTPPFVEQPSMVARSAQSVHRSSAMTQLLETRLADLPSQAGEARTQRPVVIPEGLNLVIAEQAWLLGSVETEVSQATASSLAEPHQACHTPWWYPGHPACHSLWSLISPVDSMRKNRQAVSDAMLVDSVCSLSLVVMS